jgi:hypothetical protein
MRKKIGNIGIFQAPASHQIGLNSLVFWEKIAGVPKGSRTPVSGVRGRCDRGETAQNVGFYCVLLGHI